MRKYLSAIMLVAAPFLFTSCIEDDLVKLTDQGDSFVRFSGAAEKSLFFNAFSDVKKIALIDVDRNVPSEAKLNTSSTVKLKAAPELIDAYNEEHGSHYEWIDDNIYQFVSVPGLVMSGDDITLEYSAGDFAKSIAINLDGSKWDLSKKYAVAYKIVDAGDLKISGSDEVMVFINAKNDYDGKYEILDGTIQRYSNPTTPTVDDALNGSLIGNPNLTFSTISPTTVEISGLTWHGGTSGVGGINNLRLTVDPATNKVTMFALGNATLKNRPDLENSYNPATRTFTLNFDWNQTATKREVFLVVKWASE